jgi:4-hydroxybenzoate polyprenyltransferase/phosphoserine phosphatase
VKTVRAHPRSEPGFEGSPSSVPLCVDLDGTLIRTDILWESIVRLWRRPRAAFGALLALLLRGRPGFKSALAQAVTIDPARLPFRDDVVEFVEAERRLGREILLVTASHRLVAERVADHVGLFSSVLATGPDMNLSGAKKRAALESRYGARGFDYIGDSWKDLPVFSAARAALLVSPSKALLRKASAGGNVARVFASKGGPLAALAKALRVHQWAKNALLVVPLLAAHRFLDISAWLAVAIAFGSFCAVASATYLINDLLDLDSDRVHPQKRFRPLASGRLAIPSALGLTALLGSGGLVAGALWMPPVFVAYLVGYVALTLGYSFELKRRAIVDVLALALLYTVRILAGGAATATVVSEWLLMFSLFLFLSLAFVKRVIELDERRDDHNRRVAGRGYSPSDLETVRMLGIASGLVSVLVLALYITSPVVTRLYQAPQFLWLICPLLLYWIARIWMLAGRGELHHDPVVFALQDGRSFAVGVLAVAVMLLAQFGPATLHW